MQDNSPANIKNTGTAESQENQFDVLYLLHSVWYLRYWIILSVVASAVIAAIYLKTKTDMFASQMMILITTDKNAGMSNSAQISFIQDMTGISSFNSLENEKVIIKSTPVVQKVVEAQHLNIRYFVEHTFRHEETPCQEIHLDYLPAQGYNVNSLPQIRIDYDVIDESHLKVSVLDRSRLKMSDKGYLVRDKELTLPGTISLPRYGDLEFTFRPRPVDEFATTETAPADHFEYVTPGKHYILLYSPQVRAQEICSAMSVYVVEEGKHSMGGMGGSSILNISMTDNMPKRAEALLEGIVEQYNIQTKDYYTLSYTNTMEFIQNRLGDLKSQLTGVEGRIKDFSIGNKVYDLQSQANFNLNTEMQRRQKAQEIEIQVSLLGMVLKELSEQKEFQTIPSNVGIADNTIITSITEYNRLCVERIRLLGSSSESSPVIKQLYVQLEARRDLICKTIQNQISILNSQRDELMHQIGRSEDEMHRLPTQKLNLAEIQREQSIIEPLYVLLQKKREETMLAIIAEPDIARIVEHSENNTAFVGPNRRKIWMIALVLGFLLPIGINYLLSVIKTKITSPDDITSRTRIPILGIVPQGTSRVTKAAEIIKSLSTSTTTEVFRSIRSSLAFTDSKVLQVTSSIPSEGKSFVSTNLAICFASAGKKTIILETDMRKGHLRRTFDVTHGFRAGLSEYLSEQEDDWHKLCYHVPGIEGLDVMLKGAIPPNPNELLSSNRLEKLIEALKAEYDYIILDSPPYLLIADPITTNRVADCNIYVMRAGVSDLRFVGEVNLAVTDEKLTKPYIVLNGMNFQKQGYYRHSRYGYGYGYAYGYSYGYGEQQKKKRWWRRGK